MTPREIFFDILKGNRPEHPLFLPDISTWYENTRKPYGTEQIYGCGEYIRDDDPFHQNKSHLTGSLACLKYSDYFRQFGWGLPSHISSWHKTFYTGGVKLNSVTKGEYRYLTYETPKGSLNRTYRMDHDGSWANCGYWINDLKEFDILKYIVTHTEFEPDSREVDIFFNEVEDIGVCDLPVGRSPFGKMVHEYLGFQNTVYTLYDEEDLFLEFLQVQQETDLKLIDTALELPAKVIIISDHADENLIAPSYYKDYCIPYYHIACEKLHKAGRYVSTHLDGNIKGYMKILKDTGFDYLDGCTPAPMFNYQPEDLANAILPGMTCFCGVPASMFVGSYTKEEVCQMGRRIAKAFDNRVFVNVGDILPPNGNIDLVIAVGEALARM